MAAADHTSRYFWIVLGLSIVVGLAFQGSRGLYESTEGRYAEVAREMLETGNYLEPTKGYRAHWTKPPLAYWAIAGGMQILGRNEWGARLSNAAAFTLTVLLVARMGVLLWGRQAGIIAGLVYATSLCTLFGMNGVSTDTLLTLWETAAVFCFLKTRQATDRTSALKWNVFMWACFGLAFMTKGPPGLLPLLAMWAWRLCSRKSARLFTLAGVATFLVTGLWWYALVVYRHPELVTYFLGQEVVARVASDTFDRNSEWYKPFVIYLPFLTIGAGAWFYFLVKTVIAGAPFRVKDVLNDLKAGKPESFLIAWIAIPLLVFFLSQSRLPLYVLPLYAPVALFIGRGMHSRNSLRTATIVAAASAIVLVGLKGAAAYFPHKDNMRQLYETCRRVGDGPAVFAAYRERELFGLQFYLNGNLVRLADREKEWSDATLAHYIENTVKKNPGLRHVFLARHKYADKLKGTIDANGLTVHALGDAFWQLYVVDPP